MPRKNARPAARKYRAKLKAKMAKPKRRRVLVVEPSDRGFAGLALAATAAGLAISTRLPKEQSSD